MPTLRITQTSIAPGRFRADLALTGLGPAPHVATSNFDFTMTPHEHEDLRWYLEDYLQYPHDPAPQRAARIEAWLRDRGVVLFDAVFPAGRPRDLWAKLRDHLSDTRIEIVATVEQATLIPWELLRDPQTDTPLALQARVFTRAQPESARQPKPPEVSADGPIRILLVICRPGAANDVPFRSVAGRLIKPLAEDTRKLFQLDVLRPPTFEQLSRILRAAKADGRPYHVVHFDGHGMYAEIADSPTVSQWLRELAPFVLGGPRKGPHGYLLFENPAHEHNFQPVDGTSLGALLAETGVSTLVLNACRSAHAEPTSEPDVPVPQAPDSQHDHTDELDNPNARVRALGSLAQEVMDQGVAGVVAMRYNVYVVTAAKFVADLYSALTEGRTLGEAVTLGRKQLAANPQREIAFEPRALQDWPVPVVFEAAPIRLFPEKQQDAKLIIAPAAELDETARGALDDALPRSPDVGFFGRDETLLAIDRAFDTQHVVLLHAFAGSGKTAAAAEFARWYSLTGGVNGPVIYTSFEQFQPLPRVLDRIGQVFGRALEQTGVNWLALDDPARRSVALDVLRQVPVLWVWDNVEPVAGFPAGTASTWSVEEQQALAHFLRDARASKAKFLLTSRRDERAWLGDLPVRIALPPMPMLERVALARALANKHGKRITDVHAWWPLLHFTQGNPLTLTVVVSQALRDGLTTRNQIEYYVDKLRAGEAAFDDDITEGRPRSLSASLNYGFTVAFTETERRQLALLHCFQGFVNTHVLHGMYSPDAEPDLSHIVGSTRTPTEDLLARAAEIGLLTAQQAGGYFLHPALPAFLQRMFQHYYGPVSDIVDRSFVRAMATVAEVYVRVWSDGNEDTLEHISDEQGNLLKARRIALQHGLNDWAIDIMQGLSLWYLTSGLGRDSEWHRLVDEIAPEFVDPRTEGPLPGVRQESWHTVMNQRVQLARARHDVGEARRILQICLDWARVRGQTALDSGTELTGTQRDDVRNYALTLKQLAEVQREAHDVAYLESTREALFLSQQIGDMTRAASCALILGRASMDAEAPNLDDAELWTRRSLDWRNEREVTGRARCRGQLGLISYSRFIAARASGRPKSEQLGYVNCAIIELHRALEDFPERAFRDRALTCNFLGGIYANLGFDKEALRYMEHGIRLYEVIGDDFDAGKAKLEVAEFLKRKGKTPEGLDYARVAARQLARCGSNAAQFVSEANDLIAAFLSAPAEPTLPDDESGEPRLQGRSDADR